MSKRTSGPKRAIKRVRNRIDHQMSSSASPIVLHAVEENMTLVRTIIDVNIRRRTAATGEDDYDIVISKAPNAVTVAAPALAQALDQNEPNEAIWRCAGGSGVVSASNEVPQFERIYRDIKGMRKLREDDNITWSDIASTNNIYEVIGYVILFFKMG